MKTDDIRKYKDVEKPEVGVGSVIYIPCLKMRGWVFNISPNGRFGVILDSGETTADLTRGRFMPVPE